MISLTNHDFQWARSELVIIYPELFLITTFQVIHNVYQITSFFFVRVHLPKEPWLPSTSQKKHVPINVYIYIHMQARIYGHRIAGHWKCIIHIHSQIKLLYIYIHKYVYIYTWLVVLNPLKNMKVNGKDDIPCMKWKRTFMFETTNHYIYIHIYIYI